MLTPKLTPKKEALRKSAILTVLKAFFLLYVIPLELKFFAWDCFRFPQT
jgi:hypothetical protein